MSKLQTKIVKYFIKSSPVGEVNLVLKDVCNIIDKEILENADIKIALRDYFEQHRQHIKLPDGRVAMVTDIGRQNPISTQAEEAEEEGKEATPAVEDPFVYFDSKLGLKFKFDPNTLTATILGEESDFPEQLDEQWQTYKSGVAEAVEEYVKSAYRDGTTRASLCFNQDGNLQIDISCINLNFASYWGGEWQATWVVDTQNNTLSGSIKINNHYFEQGNIQYNLSKDFEGIQLAAADGEGIVKAIRKTETDYQTTIEEMHGDLQTSVFKRMRRALPVTGQLFNWDKPKLLH